MPTPKTFYECSVCATVYPSEKGALECEIGHLARAAKDDNSNLDCWTNRVLKSNDFDPCEYCSNYIYYGLNKHCYWGKEEEKLCKEGIASFNFNVLDIDDVFSALNDRYKELPNERN